MGDAARAAGVESRAQLTMGTSLYSIVLTQTGQDINRCCRCELCEEITDKDGDVSLTMLLQWILVNDERALTNATVWSDEVLHRTDHACASQLNMPAILEVLRAEARRRGLH